MSGKKDEARNQPDPAPDKGDVYVWRCICALARLRIASHLSKTREINDAKAFLSKVESRLSSRQMLLTSDKLKAYPLALLEVFGVSEGPCSDPESRPTKRRRNLFPPGFLYGQIDKERSGGRLVCIDRKAVVGTHDQINAVLNRDGQCKVINTSLVERDNLSVRQHNGRLVRKTLSYSKDWQMHQASIDFEDALHNFVRPHFSLRLPEPSPENRIWAQRTPAMAAGITDHLWSVRELVTYRPPPR